MSSNLTAFSEFKDSMSAFGCAVTKHPSTITVVFPGKPGDRLVAEIVGHNIEFSSGSDVSMCSKAGCYSYLLNLAKNRLKSKKTY